VRAVDGGLGESGFSRGLGDRAGGPLVVLLALATLALHAAWYDPGRLHVSGAFVDQAAYVTTARTLVDEGELRSGLVFPTVAHLPRWRPYMPGHYLSLALSYGLFGWGVLQSLLPNLLAYVLATLGVFGIAERTCGRRRAFVAAFLFAWFPANVTFAFTAMAEGTFVAACVVALWGFAVAPARWRPLALPLLVALPFLFRETALLLLLPMVAWLRAGGARWRVVLGSAGAALGLLLALNAWQIADGKGAISSTWVTKGRFLYAGTAVETPDWSVGEWASAFAGNARRNLEGTVERISGAPFAPSLVGFLALVACVPAALVVGWRRRRSRDPFLLGFGLCALAMLGALYVLYDVRGWKPLRTLMFTVPLGAVGLAGALRHGRGASVGLAVFALGSLWLSWRSGAELLRLDDASDEAVATLESFGHDDGRLVMVDRHVAPYLAAYAVEHYPVPWSFVPANRALFRGIAARDRLHTLVRALPHRPAAPAPPRWEGMRLLAEVDLGDEAAETGRKRYAVYRAD